MRALAFSSTYLSHVARCGRPTDICDSKTAASVQGGGGTGGGAGGGAAQAAAQRAVARHLAGLAGPSGTRLAAAAVPALFCEPAALGFAAGGDEWLHYRAPPEDSEPAPGPADAAPPH